MWGWIVAGSAWAWGEAQSRAGGSKRGKTHWWFGENSVWGRWIKGEVEGYRSTGREKWTPIIILGVLGFIIVTKWKPR